MMSVPVSMVSVPVSMAKSASLYAKCASLYGEWQCLSEDWQSVKKKSKVQFPVVRSDAAFAVHEDHHEKHHKQVVRVPSWSLGLLE